MLSTAVATFSLSYLYLFLPANQPDIVNLRAGAAQQNVSQDIIREMMFVIPPVELTAKFNQIAEPLFGQAHRLQRKVAILRKTRDLLLPKLISGNLDIDQIEIESGKSCPSEN